MKITLVGPGIMPIPPVGWGAVEILVWDTKSALEELGHEVQIVNTKDPSQIINEINDFRPDFVHVHYDEFIGVYPYIQYPKAITSHFGYIERKEMFNGYVNILNSFAQIKPNVFCLSEGIKNVYKVIANIPEDNLFITPNGVNTEAFSYTENPEYGDRSIYLAKIERIEPALQAAFVKYSNGKSGFLPFNEIHPKYYDQRSQEVSEAIEEIATRGARLLITIDCGIADVEEVAFANEKGIDVIITDHHLPPDKLPPAFAITSCSCRVTIGRKNLAVMPEPATMKLSSWRMNF
jgi:hypothetical protein